MGKDIDVPKKGGAPLTDEEKAARRAFGLRLKVLMRLKKLNQPALAKAAHLDRTMVSRLMTGDRRVNGDQVTKLSAALGVTPADLWSKDLATGAEEQASPDFAMRQVSDPSVILPAQLAGGGYRVKTKEGEFMGRQLDEIEDAEIRDKAFEAGRAAVKAILHPSKLGAGKGPGRVQRK